ncbi:ABC transporter ATP-binding protein [Candidatus Borrarchaeum sp.]|uniref:ABC transporter ATP-binding protein n=1 Tax=Candidatus Borrarchaeum sp. TaxID=2846742 RepID=UPI0025809E75|nr:ABC transporter ATP-binding protein [Candidatus Borrarchaeum sp.]
MLQIENLTVSIDDKEVLHSINLEIKEGEIHALFGPNGSGKTSLLMTIMGFPDYNVTTGRIVFRGENITHLTIDERAKRGIGYMFQRPPTIKGLKMKQLVELCAKNKPFNVKGCAEKLNLETFLERDINQGFSGGEIKRAELLQLLAQNPNLLLLDEPTSGVDLENIALIGSIINDLFCADLNCENRRTQPSPKAGLIITHTGYILDYVKADIGHVMCNGNLGCSGTPSVILANVRKMGYEECVACLMKSS